MTSWLKRYASALVAAGIAAGGTAIEAQEVGDLLPLFGQPLQSAVGVPRSALETLSDSEHLLQTEVPNLENRKNESASFLKVCRGVQAV